MDKVYGDLIRKGVKTYSQVPLTQKQAVHEYLFSLGLDDNGIILPIE